MSDKAALSPDLIIYAFEPGTTVTIADGEITGLINCVCVYAHSGILYEVAYWRDGERKTAWVNSMELRSDMPRKVIGFSPPQQ